MTIEYANKLRKEIDFIGNIGNRSDIREWKIRMFDLVDAIEVEMERINEKMKWLQGAVDLFNERIQGYK